MLDFLIRLITLLVVIIFSCSCENNNETPLINSNLPDSTHSTDSQSKAMVGYNLNCVDTFFLIESNITYNVVDSKRRDNKEWVLSSVREFKIHGLNKIRFFFSSYPFKNCKEFDDYFLIDSLLFFYENDQFEMKIFPEGASFTKLNKINDLDMRIIDINSDGYDDIDLYLNGCSGATNELRRYFIFNTDTHKFTDGIDLSNAGFDKDKNMIYSSWNLGAAGKLSTRIWEDLVDFDSLRLRRQEISRYDSASSLYISTITIIDEQGRKSVQLDTLD